MLYNQGLTELVHSSPSEQVAYLLVERASLLESSEDLGSAAANTASPNLLGTEKEAHTASACQVSKWLKVEPFCLRFIKERERER